MSDTKDETGSEPTEGIHGPDAEGDAAETPVVDLEELAGDDGEGGEDDLDLSDLDAYGVEGVVARLRGEGGGDDDEPTLPRRPPRSPVISLLVLGLGTYLLVSMFGDFRYWLRSPEPMELGHASSLLEDGRTLDVYDNHYVALEGTPDIPNALRLETKERYIGYMRVIEGEGGLFAAIPRSKDERIIDEVEGRFVGRLRPLAEDRAYEWLRQYYEAQQVTIGVDLDLERAPPALGMPHLTTLDGGRAEVEPGSTLWLAFDGPDARVQLGRDSFPTAKAAEEAVAALGVPYVQLEANAAFHRFVARIPKDERNAAQGKLVAGLEGLEGRPDPRKGAVVLALPVSYSVPVELASLEGDDLVFPYGENTTSLGYEVRDGRLVERPSLETLRLPLDQLRSMRLERTLEVDPEGYVVAVGETPSDARLMGIAWLVLLGIVLVNVASLVVWWRRRDLAA